MHFHKRTLLSVATLGMLAVSVVLMVGNAANLLI